MPASAAAKSGGTFAIAKGTTLLANRWMRWCTPGMGVNLWGASPLYVNPVNMLNILIKILAEGKGIVVRRCLKEARVQSYEPTNRNGI